MDTYWISEYGKVFAGYIFLMFIWPTAVFRRHLKDKSKIYHFSFCVTVQIVIVNTIVLVLGLLNILNRALFAGLFYGIFFVAIFRIVFPDGHQVKLQQLHDFPAKIWAQAQRLKVNLRAGAGEYGLLFLIIVFGVAYFSYGAFQIHTYGCYDAFTHHGWINEMVNGTIFPEGIYPAAMHSFVYSLNALFGIRVYNIMLFLQCIHIMTFLLSAYCLLREVFSWRYSPFFAMALFLTINVNNYHGMYRLPLTLPMEFGLHTQFLCVLFLIRYLKNAGKIVRKGKSSKFYWNIDLILFAMALATSISAHYYVTIMAFIVCASFAVFQLKRIINPKYLIPLIFSVICGCMIAVAPVTGALVSGIPFQGSIRWGINMINSTGGNSGNTGSVEIAETDSPDNDVGSKILGATSEDWEIISKLPGPAQKIVENIIKAENLVKVTYKYGYQGTFKPERGKRIFGITAIVVVFCIVCRLFSWEYLKKISDMYLPVVLISFISMLIYAAYAYSQLGFPVIIPNHRFCPEGFLMVFAVMMMPADILFSVGADHCRNRSMQTLSYAFTIGIYILMNILGIFHEYLYYSLMRYDSAALVTNSIIDEFDRGSYTVVSPIEERHQVTPYGEHEEISTFLKNCRKDQYTLPASYVFVYVEKRPIEYYQEYYFCGPAWLAKSRDSEIKSTEISKEAAQEELKDYSNGLWDLYVYDRTILESKAYEWCQQFSERYPLALHIYYEDDDLVCYYFKQDLDNLYNLTGE